MSEQNNEVKKVHRFAIVVDEKGGMTLEDASTEDMIVLERGDMMDYVVSLAEILKEHKNDLKLEKMFGEAIATAVSSYIKMQRELFEEIDAKKKKEAAVSEEKETPTFLN